MKLRDHPLMTYMGVRSWPLAWLWKRGYDSTHPQGEVGILKNVMLSTIAPHSTCFLSMEHCGAQYIGALLVSDPAFIEKSARYYFKTAARPAGTLAISYTL